VRFHTSWVKSGHDTVGFRFGLFLFIPVIDHVVAVIDERIQTTAFSAEEALTAAN
jgi:hypothetical protein